MIVTMTVVWNANGMVASDEDGGDQQTTEKQSLQVPKAQDRRE